VVIAQPPLARLDPFRSHCTEQVRAVRRTKLYDESRARDRIGTTA
jgi:hypothetical protein